MTTSERSRGSYRRRRTTRRRRNRMELYAIHDGGSQEGRREAMNGKSMRLLVGVASIVALALPSAGLAASPAYSPQAVKALGERYEAMVGHNLGDSATGYSPQALRALGERWEAAARYHQQAQLEQARRQAAAFDWADAGIGAFAAIGAVALLGLGALGLRSRTPGRPASPAVS
jgi:hypothetical protein